MDTDASHPLSENLTAILFDVTDGVGVITLNRPDKYNSCDLALVTELEHLYKEIRYDDTVKVWHEQHRAAVDAPIPLCVTTWRDALWTI